MRWHTSALNAVCLVISLLIVELATESLWEDLRGQEEIEEQVLEEMDATKEENDLYARLTRYEGKRLHFNSLKYSLG